MRRIRRSAAVSLPALALASALVPGSAGAQTAAAPADQAAAQEEDARGPILKDIVVSGRRADQVQVGSFRGSTVLDVPLTVTIIDRETLNAQQVQNLGDVLKNTPGVNFSQTSPAVSTNVTIRGISVENRTNYRLNGGLPVVNLIDMPTEAFERVEVLKGVSSLYYGFTTPAGIINLVAKRATPEPVTALNFTANDDGGYVIHADVGRMSEDGSRGFRVNLVAGDPHYGVDRTTGSRRAAVATLDLKPTDTMNLRLDAQYIHKDITEPALFQLTAVNGRITLPPLLDLSENFSSPWMKTIADETNVQGHLDWRFLPNVQLILEAGESDVVRTRQGPLLRNINFTTGAGQLRVASANGLNFNNKNYRGELAVGFRTGPVTHQASVGIVRNKRFAGTALVVNTDLPYNIYTRPLLPQVALPAGVIPNPTTITDTGYYAFDKASLGDIVDVLAGVRRTNYKNISLTSPAYRVNVTSLSGGIVVKPIRTVSIYASYIEGLEEGGVAPQTVNNPGAILPPNESTQKEVGVKWQATRGALFAVSYFDIDRASSFVNAANFFVQDGRTRYKGVEASLTGRLTPELNLILSGTHINAKQAAAADRNLIGKPPENTPKWTAAAFADYALPFAPGLSVNGGAYYTAKRAVNNLNQAFVPAFTLFSAGAAYRTQLGSVPTTLRVTADNLSNKRYFAGTGASIVSYGLPRLIKASLGFQF